MNIAVKRDEAEVPQRTVFERRRYAISYAMVDGYLIVGQEVRQWRNRLEGINPRVIGKVKDVLASLPPGRTTEASGMFYEDPGQWLHCNSDG